MDTKKPEQPQHDPKAPERRVGYEPPRILAKRKVEHTTLVTGTGGPGGGVGGD